MNKQIEAKMTTYSHLQRVYPRLVYILLTSLLISIAYTYFSSELFYPLKTGIVQISTLAFVFALCAFALASSQKILSLCSIVIAGGIVFYIWPELSGYKTILIAFAVWFVVFAVIYLVSDYSDNKTPASFDFYNGEGNEEKQNIFDDGVLNVAKPTNSTPFLIDDDGLDPSIVFNVQKTGALKLILIEEIVADNNISDYLAKQEITTKILGAPINGVSLMEMKYQNQQGYYRLRSDNLYATDDDVEGVVNLDVAFLKDNEVLNERVEIALLEMLNAHSSKSVIKYNAKNYQAMFKFYNYVKNLEKEENRSVDQFSFYQGTFEISNSSYVELYNCNLQSTLTSWVNKDGLIHTDYLDEDDEPLPEDQKEQLLTTIGLPFPECRLTDIHIISSDDPLNIKLYITLSELKNDELTGESNALSVLMQDKSIIIKRDEVVDNRLMNIDEFFDSKTIFPFFPG